jgi:acyl dehydratase
MIPYERLLKVQTPEREYSWSDQAVMLYALGIGFGADPLNERELPFVYEQGLRVVPTFATVAAWGSELSVEEMQVNRVMAVHGEQGLQMHRPLPVAARILAGTRVVAAVDKGDKGAIIISETVLRDAATREPLVTLIASMFARADGHFGGPASGGLSVHPIPSREPDEIVEIGTRRNQALLYRLSGDRNPLHADREVAQAAGFDQPILHGLCTYGLTCRAVLGARANYQVERIKSHHVRFSAPMFPGETLLVRLWQDGDVVSFEAFSKERGVAVIKNGKSVLEPSNE